MKRVVRPSALLLAILALVSAIGGRARADADGAALYGRHCAACHGADRLGGTGPALIPEALVRLKLEAAKNVIAQGRPATQMPGFAATLAAPMMRWQPTSRARWRRCRAGARLRSRRAAPRIRAGPPVERPVFKADPLNLFVVVETGDHHVTILDGDKFEAIHRFATRYALHGGPKFTADGRFVFFASRDGWITKFDLWGLKVVAGARGAQYAQHRAVQRRRARGRGQLPAEHARHSLRARSPRRKNLRGGRQGRQAVARERRLPGARAQLVHRRSEGRRRDLGDRHRPERAAGLHRARPQPRAGHGGGAARLLGPFRVQRIAVEEPLDDFFFDQAYRHPRLGARRQERRRRQPQRRAGDRARGHARPAPPRRRHQLRPQRPPRRRRRT